MKTGLRWLYHQLPVSLRLGAAYRRQRRELAEAQDWSRARVEAWQAERLAEVIRHAAVHTEYYRAVFERAGLRPEEVRDVATLARVPLLRKADLQRHGEAMVARDFDRGQLEAGTTSGSTGVPTAVYRIRRTGPAVETAFVHHAWGRFGYRPGGRHAHFRGYLTGGGISARHGRDLLLSSFDIREETLPAFEQAIRDFAPDYIQAYPSSLLALCRHLRRVGRPAFPSVRSVLCSSENLTEADEIFIEETLGVRVCNLYGHVEQAAFACSCPHDRRLHVEPHYGLVELLREDGTPCQDEGELGEIVATSFVNPAFPLIRYATGDLARLSLRPCACGWNHLLLDRIEGRRQDYVVGRDGRRIAIAALNLHSRAFDRVSQFQFWQGTAGAVVLKVVPREGYSPEDARLIAREIGARLGGEVALAVQEVDAIPRGGRGKQRFLVQELTLESRAS